MFYCYQILCFSMSNYLNAYLSSTHHPGSEAVGWILRSCAIARPKQGCESSEYAFLLHFRAINSVCTVVVVDIVILLLLLLF